MSEPIGARQGRTGSGSARPAAGRTGALAAATPGRCGLGGAAAVVVALAGALSVFMLSAPMTHAAPTGLDTMREFALELLRAEDYGASIEVYREITRHTPDDPESHYDLAAALSFINLYDEAVAPVRRMIELAPGDPRGHEMAALLYLNLGRHEEAFTATLASANLGVVTSMYTLVNMYEKGLGVAADPDRAIYWAERAAEHGHLGAMGLLEEAYRTGRLARRPDPARAARWARRLRDAQ